MPPGTDYISLRKALKDYFREQGITLSDLLSLMDEEKKGVMKALRERVHLTESQSRKLEKSLTSRDLNLLLFVVQAFYILNHSGLYKGFIIEPTREEVMLGNKATFEGCKMILKSLQVSTIGLDD